MGEKRRGKRKLTKLSNDPQFIKRYNHQVRKYNGRIAEEKEKDKMFEYYILLFLLAICCGVLCYRLWQKA